MNNVIMPWLPGLSDFLGIENSAQEERRRVEWENLKQKGEGSQSASGMLAAEEYLRRLKFYQWGCGDNLRWDARPFDICIRWSGSGLPDHIVMPIEIRSVAGKKDQPGRNGEMKGKCPVGLIYRYIPNQIEFFVYSAVLRKKLHEIGKVQNRGSYWYDLVDIWSAWEEIMVEKSMTTLSL